MFEDELELERHQSMLGPAAIILGIIVLIGATIFYVVTEATRQMPPEEAAALVSQVLEARGPATIHFHCGDVAPSADEKPGDPHYRLLEKAGIVRVRRTGAAYRIALTDEGERRLAQCSAEKHDEEKGDISYTVPLAYRRLVDITQVTMHGPDTAEVAFTWQWQPTEMGKDFDLSGDLVRSFQTWERVKLIERYGADYYNAEPSQDTVTFVRTKTGWKVLAG